MDACIIVATWLVVHVGPALAMRVGSIDGRQTLVWVGMFYAPLLPVIACVVSCIVFYAVQWSMRTFLARPRTIFRAANTTYVPRVRHVASTH